ncbi:MarR family winged helix-turn-helix transcriptional regulator [Frankia sp. QA3]|uniref:MarR family winged helix-turn-helix transcriptional regulator n=1 Tax=Frankia sp. QA3 TaxID=710111 RepID=UPI00055C76B0|nr:MarR family transcriptional regulator [Frankia sp. QA3]
MGSQPLFEHPACLITQLDVHVQEQLIAQLAPLGIHPRHFGVLSLLIEQDGLSQHQLSAPLSVHRNVMVGLVDDMERRGLVDRQPHPTDRRAHAVRLLPAGRQLHAEAEALVSEFEAKLLGGLDAAEARAFTSLLMRVCENAGLYHDIHPGLRASSGESLSV